MNVRISKQITLPDPVRLALYRRSPDLGPKILFFSGGSALKKACAEIVRYSHNTIHILTPFDSGGSSATLREAFSMPSIGDIRNRLLALADRNLHGNPEVCRLFSHRFPADGDPADLLDELEGMIDGSHPLTAAVPEPLNRICRQHLGLFRKHMPDQFDLKKASIGNLILTGGYLGNDRHLGSVIYIFSKLVKARGIVRPAVNDHFHLVAELEDDRVVVGQHLLTGKEAAPIGARVRRIYLSDRLAEPRPARVTIDGKIADLIAGADLICFPIGSFYSSLMANLLPRGMAGAIRANPCAKVYVPNTVPDPETYGMTLSEQIGRLVDRLGRESEDGASPGDLLNFLMVDRENGHYAGGIDDNELKNMGIETIDCRLITPDSAPLIDEKQLTTALFSLV
jgi:CofD-related protein of GAK system